MISANSSSSKHPERPIFYSGYNYFIEECSLWKLSSWGWEIAPLAKYDLDKLGFPAPMQKAEWVCHNIIHNIIPIDENKRQENHQKKLSRQTSQNWYAPGSDGALASLWRVIKEDMYPGTHMYIHTHKNINTHMYNTQQIHTDARGEKIEFLHIIQSIGLYSPLYYIMGCLLFYGHFPLAEY